MAENKNNKHDLEAGWIRELADILQDTGLTEIEIEKNDIRLRVSRQGNAAVVHQAPAVTQTAPVQSQESSSAESITDTIASHPGTVKSPMVGTAYLAPSPEAPVFVKVGDQVKEGQTLMIVEAMKTMNPITAPRSGTIQSILIADAQPVEFDDALLIIE